MMPRRHTIVSLVLGSLVASTPLAAQVAGGAGLDSSSSRLLNSVLNAIFNMSGQGAPPRLYIRSLPRELENEVPLPKGSELLLSIDRGAATEVIASVPLPGDSARAEIERALMAKGWLRAPSPMAVMTRGGLMPPQMNLTAPRYLCRAGNDMVNVYATPSVGRANSSDVRIAFQNEGPPCTQQDRAAQVAARQASDPFAMFPQLMAPPQATYCMSNSGGGNTSTSGFPMTIPLTPAEILTHYASQMERAGWRTVTQPALVEASWARSDSTGRRSVATLRVQPRSDATNCYDLRLELRASQ